MNDPIPAAVPRRPTRQWPVGLRVCFKSDADLLPQYLHLRGTSAMILSELKLIPPSASNLNWSWRQEILSYAGGCRIGWARPDQLDLPEDRDIEPDYAAQRRQRRFET